jgi:hypothetical protein
LGVFFCAPLFYRSKEGKVMLEIFRKILTAATASMYILSNMVLAAEIGDINQRINIRKLYIYPVKDYGT